MDCSAGEWPTAGRERPPQSWIEAIFARWQAGLVSYTAARLRGNHEDARDVVQEAFVKLCQQDWPDIEPHAAAWLYKTCRNRAIDILRRERRMSTAGLDSDLSGVRDKAAQPPDEHASQDEQLVLVKRQIGKLPDQQQEVLRLRVHDGLSYKQIAKVTGLSVSNVGYHLHQAVSLLRVKLASSS